MLDGGDVPDCGRRVHENNTESRNACALDADFSRRSSPRTLSISQQLRRKRDSIHPGTSHADICNAECYRG
jgi:hypothetical protein